MVACVCDAGGVSDSLNLEINVDTKHNAHQKVTSIS